MQVIPFARESERLEGTIRAESEQDAAERERIYRSTLVSEGWYPTQAIRRDRRLAETPRVLAAARDAGCGDAADLGGQLLQRGAWRDTSEVMALPIARRRRSLP
jgi:hypothetical protein